jgi:hypothetical protein
VLTGVSCVSASFCTAVGAYAPPNRYLPLAESWNGTTWSIVPSPHKGTFSPFNGVSCVSASACTAVGVYATKLGGSRTLIESWDGTQWSVVPSPNKTVGANADILAGVSCVSGGACIAVGHYTRGTTVNRTLAESDTPAP